MKKIRIGQLGIGHNHGTERMKALRSLADRFEVVGVAEDSPKWREKRGAHAAYQGLPMMSVDELLAVPGLEAVMIETDGGELLPSAIRCAERGLHLCMDKPGGEDLPGFGKLCDAVRSRDLVLQLGYVYRNNPAVNFCVDAVKNGWLGEVFEIHAVMSRWDKDEYRRWLSQFHGGAMYIFAGYLIDIVLRILGAPERVTPFMKRTRDDGLVDNGLAVLEYPRATATVRVSVAEVEGYKHRRLIVCGTNGTVELCPIEYQQDDAELNVRLTLKEPRAHYASGTRTVDCGPRGNRYAAQMIEFARAVRGEIANPFPVEHEYLLHETLLRASGYPLP
jgi:predicted dehydrogenase